MEVISTFLCESNYSDIIRIMSKTLREFIHQNQPVKRNNLELVSCKEVNVFVDKTIKNENK